MKRKIAVINRTRVRTGFVAGVLSLSLLALAPAVDAATIETAADRIARAVDNAYAHGVKPMELGGRDGTAEVARAVIAAL